MEFKQEAVQLARKEGVSVAQVAREISVFREVAGKHAFYFSGLEPNALAQAVKNWFELFESKKHQSSENMPWLFWEESASRFLEIPGIEKSGMGPSQRVINSIL